MYIDLFERTLKKIIFLLYDVSREHIAAFLVILTKQDLFCVIVCFYLKCTGKNIFDRMVKDTACQSSTLTSLLLS